MAEDEDTQAEMEAVQGCYSEGFEDGWYFRPLKTNSYDQEAYNRGYQEGANAASGTFHGGRLYGKDYQ